MGDLYSECLVKRKTPAYAFAVKLVIFAVMLIFITLTVLTISVIPLIAAIGFGVLFYFYYTGTNVEYEYIFVNGELDIDKIMNQSRRKRALTFDMGHLEILAPEDSVYLGGYEGRSCKTYDFSSNSDNGGKRYILYGNENNGTVKIILEPNDNILNDMRMHSPGKVKLQ